MDSEVLHINWNCPAGRRLDQLAALLPQSPRLEIIVFGSAPLQIFIAASFLSEDVDLFSDEASHDLLVRVVEENHLGKEQTQHYIQVCMHNAFRSAEDWRSRTVNAERHGHLFRIVHPWDVLVSKLQRLEEKDLEAFKLVLAKTAHPTEAEFKRHLQKAVDLYRPKFDEETARGDMMLNTQTLWRELWGKEIDVRAEIIRPALAQVPAEYSEEDPTLKQRLANLKLPERKPS